MYFVCRFVFVQVINDVQVEGVFLVFFVGYYVIFEILVFMYEFVVVINRFKFNKKS